jgi:hypothetical protein
MDPVPRSRGADAKKETNSGYARQEYFARKRIEDMYDSRTRDPQLFLP